MPLINKKLGHILFLDADGTVRKGPNELGHFVNAVSDVEVFPEMKERIAFFKNNGWQVVIISNQGGIAMGHVSFYECQKAMEETNKQCHNLLDHIFMCPHHPQSKNKAFRNCFCRKPNTGLLHKAVLFMESIHKDKIYIPQSCLYVGDREEDRLCAESACVDFIEAESFRKMPLDKLKEIINSN